MKNNLYQKINRVEFLLKIDYSSRRNSSQIFSIILIAFFIFVSGYETMAQIDSIYHLEDRLMKGDKMALFEIAKYFDSDKKVIERLGYHRIETVESAIAKKIVKENCLFTEDEISIGHSTSAKQFLDFLNLKKDSIVFSELSTSFLITPLDKRDVKYEIRRLTEIRKKELIDSSKKILNYNWIKMTKIDSLIQQKNPLSLFMIASEYFKERERWDRYNFNGEEFIELLQLLTGIELGIGN